ncbi:hypothetical protein ACF3MZ_30520 [Paenibacillaceae bacterium WGS1546]|uniref:hypothetical protein n=1 Tax=Cohnella sp. WGS1546 TaxID=3366810 RepID=UPI00372D5D26
MKVTVKVKHLFGVALLLGAVFLTLQFVVIPKLQVRAAIQDYEAGAAGGKTKLLSLIDKAPEEERWRLIREYMLDYGSDSLAYSYDVIVGPGFTMGGGKTDAESRIWSWEDKVPYLRMYVEGAPADADLVGAVKQLVRYEISEGRADSALATLEEAERRLSGEWRGKLKLERAKLHAGRGNPGEAMRLIEELEAGQPAKDMDFNADVLQFRAQLLAGEGRGAEALDALDREIEATKQRMAEEKEKFPEMGEFTPVALESMTSLRKQLADALNRAETADATVAGQISRSDGRPLARVGVFLRSEKDVYNSITAGEPYQTMTDAQGRYAFNNVIPGNYQLYIGLRYEQIDGWTWPTMTDDWIVVVVGDSRTENVTLQPLIEIEAPVDQQTVTTRTVDFRWRPVEGAASYTLFGTIPMKQGSISLQIAEGISGHSVELPIHRLYETGGGYSYREEDGQLVLDPASVLGFANPNLRYSWYVEAYDGEGRLLTRSNGYRLNEDTMGALPFFYLKERTLTEGDELLLDGRLEEAMAAYKTAYDTDPADRHSLYMITRILGAQASMNRDTARSDEEVAYLERLLAFDPGNGGTLFNLFDAYEQRRNWSKVDDYYRRYLSTSGNKPNEYTQSRYATALMKQRRMEEAAKEFREALERDRSHRFVGNFLAVELYAGASFESVTEIADAYPEFGSGKPDWRKLVEALARESAGQDYRAALSEALEASFDDRAGPADANRYPALRAFVAALGQVG